MMANTSGWYDPNAMDFDQDFESWQSGDPSVAITNLRHLNGNDFSVQYAPLSVGSALGRNVGARASNGSDAAALFAKKGSRAGSALSASIPSTASANAGGVSGTTVTVQLNCTASGGTGTGYTFAWSIVSGTGTISAGGNTVTATIQQTNVTGTTQTVVKCHVTDSASDAADSNQCTITFSVGGGGGGGGSVCVAEDMYLRADLLARDAKKGDSLDCALRFARIGQRPIRAIKSGEASCVEMVAANGCALIVTPETSFEVDALGASVLAADMLSHPVLTDLGESTIVSVRPLPGLYRILRIDVNNVSYAAGIDSGHRIWSHNVVCP